MRQDIAKQWSAALRSGAYKQVRGLLHTPNGMCCLGVLCDIVKDDLCSRPTWVDLDGLFVILGQSKVLPADVVDFVGMSSTMGRIGTHGRCLANENDDGISFEGIAKLIDAHWEKL